MLVRSCIPYRAATTADSTHNMNGTWDATELNQGSVWQDAFIGATKPANLSPFHTFFKHHAASQGAGFANLPTNENIAFDEIHPSAYPDQTRAAAKTWAVQVTQVVLLAVEWTCTPAAKDVLEGIIEANNPLVRIAQEFYYFGETGQHTDPELINWYASRNYVGRVDPIYIVSNNWSKYGPENLYCRACCKNPGAKSAYDASIMRAMAAYGSYNAFQWGVGYRDPNELVGGQPKAVKAWDSVLASVYFRG